MDRDEVEWREHPTILGYRISSTGRVQTRWRVTSRGYGKGTKPVLGDAWREHTLQRLPNGYIYVQIRGFLLGEPDRERKTVYAHALVAEAFIGPRPDGFDVCHANNDRSDNTVGNLRYGSRAENMADQLRHGTRRFGSRHQNAKLTEAAVRDIILMLCDRKPKREIATRFSVSVSTIDNIRKGKAWPLVRRPCFIPTSRR